MKLRWKIPGGIAVMAGIWILGAVAHHFQLKAAVERYKAELKAKGEPMELAQTLPPPVSPDQSSADTFLAADGMFNASLRADKSLLETNLVYGARMVAPGKSMIRWQQPDVRDIDGTNSWENISVAVTQNEPALALLRQIIEKPVFRFSINYDQGVAGLNFTNLYLSESKRSASRLETAALCALNQGDVALAAKNLRAMLALVQAMHDERLDISELVRFAMAQMAWTVTWEYLQSTNLTDDQLMTLQQDWSGQDFVHSYENALAMERITGEITAAQWRSSGSKIPDYLAVWTKLGLSDHQPTAWDTFKIKTKVTMWRYWWSYPDELESLKTSEVFLHTARFIGTNDSFTDALAFQKRELQALGLDKTNDSDGFFLDPAKADMHRILSEGSRTMSAVFNKVMKVQAAKEVVIAAIALKRSQLKHGIYPPGLNSLVPDFMPAVPLDPADGQPLRYRLNADGTFLLYSIGQNGVDDGGNPALEKYITGSNYFWQNPRALDWVWPQPATAAEIQKYYEEQARKTD